MKLLYTLVLLAAMLAGCSQSIPSRHTLQTVNDKPLPAVVFDGVVQDPGEPAYHFRIEVTEGWFRFENNKYEQWVYFRSFVDSKPSQPPRWYDHGICTPQGDKLRCESNYIQNYAFELIQQGNTLTTQQEFGDPMLKGTYTFSK